jgi:DNA modification methylase
VKAPKPENHLFYGDNLTRMQHMPKHCVDLIYLDPPFNSKQNYNLIYKNMTGMPVPDQAEAFCDTWDMDPEKEELARTMPVLMREHGIKDYYVEFWRLWINALRHTQPHLLAYLIYMVERLLHMKSILRPTGSIYLHCDPTASHYIKVMMDGIFGHENFQNDVVWKRTTTHSDSKTWSRVTDNILFYTAGRAFTWNTPREPYSDEYVADKYRHDDGDGRMYQLDNMTSPSPRHKMMYEWKGFPHPEKGWRYQRETMARLDGEGRIWYPLKKDGTPDLTKRPRLKRYLDEMSGGVMGNVWTDISPVNSQARERLGYPTQKPIALLDRIIQASSNKGDVVFDPFCGCGTTIFSAVKNERRWIGCDVAILAVKMVREILTGERFRLVEGVNFDVDGIPVSVEQAQELFKRDPFQFEHWFVERVGGFPTKKTGDEGIDGRMYFQVHKGLKAMVLSVKGGKLKPGDVRDLVGVLEHAPETEMAGFLSLQEPSKGMREAAAKAGQYTYEGVKYDRVQFLTVGGVLEEKREFHTPTKLQSRVATPQASLAL